MAHLVMSVCWCGVGLGLQAALRHFQVCGPASVPKMPVGAQNHAQKSLAIGRPAPPDPALLVLACPGGLLTGNRGSKLLFEKCRCTEPRATDLVPQSTPPAADFKIVPWIPDFPFKHPDITPAAYWLNLGAPTGRSGFWFLSWRVVSRTKPHYKM